MGQCGCLKPNPAHGRWWVGSASRSQHNMDRASLGFPSFRSRRGLRSGSSGVERENHVYATLSNFLRERAMTTRSNLIAALRAMWGVRLLSLNVHLWPVLAGSWTQSSRTRTARRVPIVHRSTRRGHQLSKPSDDLSMLC